MTSAHTQPNWPLQISGDHLVDQDNTPVFIVGGTGWSGLVEIGTTDFKKFADSLAAKGYNAVILSFFEHGDFTGPNNAYNVAPFSTPDDFSTINTNYLAHIDTCLDYLETKGITAFCWPLYIGFTCSQGWGGVMNSEGPQECGALGRVLGARYADQENIVWVYGGDANSDDCSLPITEEIDSLRAGIEKFASQLSSYHSARNESAAQAYPYLKVDLNSVYTSESTIWTHVGSAQDTLTASSYPWFFVEGQYDGEGATLVTSHSQAWSGILGCGAFFGNNPLWLFDTGWDGVGTGMNSAASNDMEHLANFMASIPWSTMDEDDGTFVTAGLSSSATLVNSNYLAGYFPTSRTVTVDLSQFSGTTINAQWFNPSTGTYSTAGDGTYQPSGSANFSTGGENVLLLQSTGTPKRLMIRNSN